MNKKFSGTLFLLILTLGILIVAKKLHLVSNVNEVVINEVCSNNFNLIRDEFEQYPDYIELWNTTEEVQSLEGLYLSDDKRKLKKYSLADITLEPKQYFVLFMDGSSNEELDKEGFKLSKDGENLYLYDAIDKKILQVIAIPKIPYNKVYASETDGARKFEVKDATPGYSNDASMIYPSMQLEKPNFSVASGFYEDAFELRMSSPSKELIYYTLDGSDPTKDSNVYDGPILIGDASEQENVLASRTDLSPTRDYVPNFKVDKATVVKAMAYNPRKNTCSEVVSQTYFVGFDKKPQYQDMSIISMVVEPNNLFDSATGIYTNGDAYKRYIEDGGMQDGELLSAYEDADGNLHNLYEASNAFNRGKDWEREANISYFDEAHQYQFSQNIGIRIAGASTRGTSQKSFKLFGRDVYDEQVTFPYDFFENLPYSSVKLRNGGGNNDGMKLIDAFVESLVEERNVAIQRSKPTVLFLNGEYWGLYNIRERFTSEYVQNHYQVNPSNVWIIDAETIQEGDESALENYRGMKELIEQCDLSYDDVYDMATESIDVSSLIDYLCLNLYLDNVDIDFNQNMALWRTIEPEENLYGDCKWRWMLFDVDECLNEYDMDDSSGWMQDYYLLRTPMIHSLMQNAGFREQLRATMISMMETTFQYDEIHEKLLEWQEIYRMQTVDTIHRFFNMDYSNQDFDDTIQGMDDFFKNRNAFIQKEMDSLLELYDLGIDPLADNGEEMDE